MDSKVIFIQVAKDLNNLIIEELTISLWNYEIKINEHELKRKTKSISFNPKGKKVMSKDLQAKDSKEEELGDQSEESDDDEILKKNFKNSKYPKKKE